MATATLAKTWTSDDLFDLPEGKRYEIIGGELYEMPGTNRDHATAVVNFLLSLGPVVLALGGRIFTAPFDVFLPGADPVQPDVIVLLPGSAVEVSLRGVEGTPDLLIEIMSPSNSHHDRHRKRALYAAAGVREYWLASPEAATIEVLVLDNGTYRTLVRSGGDEPITSELLPELSFKTSSAFAVNPTR